MARGDQVDIIKKIKNPFFLQLQKKEKEMVSMLMYPLTIEWKCRMQLVEWY